MTKKLGKRRVSALIMVVAGIALMLLAPEILPGAFLFVLGVVLEVVGIALDHKSN